MDSRSKEPLINKWGSRKGLTFRPSTSDSQVQRKFKGNSNIGLSSQVEAMAFAWSALIIWGLFFFLALTLSMWPWTSHLTCRAIGSFIKLKGIPGHFLLGPSLWWKEMLHCWDFGRSHANTLIWSSEKTRLYMEKIIKLKGEKNLARSLPTHYLSWNVTWKSQSSETESRQALKN